MTKARRVGEDGEGKETRWLKGRGMTENVGQNANVRRNTQNHKREQLVKGR